jgi:putative flavoprotein involved in K+ transport
MGMFDTRVEDLKSPKEKFHAHPQISGKDGGQSLNLHKFARDGVILLGHVREARDGRLILAPDLKETLAKVYQFEIDALKKIDDYIARVSLNVPAESVPKLRDGYAQEVLTDLDLQSSGIATIIWAIGYDFDFSLVKVPVVDADGYPIQKRGVTASLGCISWDCRGCIAEARAFCSALETMALISHLTLPRVTRSLPWPVRRCETR